MTAAEWAQGALLLLAGTMPIWVPPFCMALLAATLGLVRLFAWLAGMLDD